MSWPVHERTTCDYLPGEIDYVHGHGEDKTPSRERETDRGGRGGDSVVAVVAAMEIICHGTKLYCIAEEGQVDLISQAVL
jgi:hypothetical protein